METKEPKVKIKHSKGVVELEFEQAQALLRNNSKSFAIVDKDKYEFVGKQLIKKAPPKKKKEDK